MSNNSVYGKLSKIEIPVNSPNLFCLILDSSGSMEGKEKRVRANLKRLKLDLMSMDERRSVIMSKVQFGSTIIETPYDVIGSFDTSYSAELGGTKLYYTISKVAENFLKAVEILQDEGGYSPKFTLIVFSDGEDNESGIYLEEAKKMIKRINDLGGVTAFVCFGEDISKDVAKFLGFKNIDSQVNLEKAFDAISSSCIRQSQSITSLTDTFFDNV